MEDFITANRRRLTPLALFHHGPGRTDDQLDEIAAALEAPFPVHVAREGQALTVDAETVVIAPS